MDQEIVELTNKLLDAKNTIDRLEELNVSLILQLCAVSAQLCCSFYTLSVPEVFLLISASIVLKLKIQFIHQSADSV